MRKTIFLLLMLIAGSFAYCLPHDAGSIALEDCQDYVAEDNYIDAGCCYKSLEVWDKCALNLLKGARTAEILWDLNKGSYAEGSTAKEYYNVEYSEKFGIGSDIGVCLYYNGDSNLMDQIIEYDNWIEFYGFQHTDAAPFDMDTVIRTFDNAVNPPVATPTPVPTKVATPVPSLAATPVAEADNTGLFAIIALIIIAVVAYFMFMKKKPASEPAPVYPESMEKETPTKNSFLQNAAEKAKEEHKVEHKKKHKHKKKKK